MTLDFSGFNVMEHLWETLDKTPDGKHIRYTRMDVEQLWYMGFVDTERYGLEEWRRSFEPYRQSNGTFLLNKDEFLALEKFRYTGEIHIPFDAMLINEGKYTDEGLDDLIEASIAPSCSLPEDKLTEFFDALKKEFRQEDGLILIRRPAKERIKALLYEHPSPLRNLEIILDQIIARRGDDLEGQLDQAEIDAATMEAAKQASSFSAKPTSRVEAKAKAFEDIAKVKKAAREEPEDDGTPRVELKKIKRSRKGFRG